MAFTQYQSVDKYIVQLTVLGIAILGMAWMPAIAKRTGISYSVVYMLAGVLLYSFIPDYLPRPLPDTDENITVHLTELVVIISLMGTGIRIDRPFSFKNWASPLRLVSAAMLLCIGAAAWLGYSFLGLDIASAMLLGAVLAPTDPVLASDVQVGPPNEKKKFETKFALTAEAGMNDGMAFPFTWLAITLASMANGEEASLWQWAGYQLVYKIAAGIGIGYLLGRGFGYLVFRVAEKNRLLKTNDGFLALALTLLVYGLTEMVKGYGFVAVFVTAITFRHFEKEHDYHKELHDFTDQMERALVAVMLLLFGGALVSGILAALTWKMALFSIVFLLVVRPLAAYISLFGTRVISKEKIAISFFGIRGLGTIFYLAFALREADFRYKEELWALAAFTILLSVVMHGVTATPIMKRLKRSIPEEKIPD